jgi:hypothetical protein
VVQLSTDCACIVSGVICGVPEFFCLTVIILYVMIEESDLCGCGFQGMCIASNTSRYGVIVGVVSHVR